MQSRSDGGEQDFDDWASMNGRLLPWSDDQTTATYETAQLRYLQSYLHTETYPPAPPPDDELLWQDTSSSWDASPLIIDVSDPPPRVSAPLPFPSAYVERPARRDDTDRITLADPAEDENPFARPHGDLGAWLQLTLATAALFGAVLFGRVLSHASRAPLSSQSPSVLQHTAAAPPPVVPERVPVAAAPVHSEPAVERVPTPALVPEVKARAVGLESRAPARHTLPRPSRVAAPRRAHTKPDLTPAVREPSPAPSPHYNASAAPAQAGAPSMLRINSRPWSQVFVDGRFIGVTPQLDIRVPAGTHNVRLVNPEFGMRKAFSVRVAAGESVTRVETLEE